ncbi:MAG: hypothetical protein R2788_23625 [Saprospiraceae bacterium]
MAQICVVDERTGDRITDAYLQLDPIPRPSRQEKIINKNGVSYLQMEATKVDGKEYLVLVPYDEGKEKEIAKIGDGLPRSCGIRQPIIPAVCMK